MEHDLSDLGLELFSMSNRIDQHYRDFSKNYPDIHHELLKQTLTEEKSIIQLLLEDLGGSKFFKVMRNFFFCFLIFLLAPQNSIYSQNMDSLKSIVNSNSFQLAEKEEALWSLVREYSWSDALYAMQLLDSLRNIPEIRKDSIKLMKIVRYEGKTERAVGNYVEALEKYQVHFDYYERKKDTLEMALSSGQIGIINLFNGNMNRAQEYLLKSHKFYNAKGTPSDVAGANNGLASFYADMGQTDKALERYALALEAYTAAKDTNGMANVHANTALILIEQKKYDEAERNLKLQGKYDTILGTNWGLGFHHDFMGYLYAEQGRYEEAMASYRTALEIREGEHSHYNMDESRISLANMLLKLERPEEAIQQAIRIFDNQEKQQSLSHLQSANDILARAYEDIGRYKEALRFQKAYQIVSDSIYNRDHLDEIAENDARFNKVEQDKEIAILNSEKTAAARVLKQKNRTIVLGSIGFLLISILSFLLYRVLRKVNSQKSTLAKALSDKELLIKEIHHRVKNNLQLVSSLLSMQSKNISDPSVAGAIADGKSRVRSMALIHQDLYQNSNLKDVNVKSYLDDLTKELFNTYSIDASRIHLVLNIESLDLDVDTIIPLGLIINELVTNSLKYAFPEEEEGFLRVELRKYNKELVLIVEDDGVGYDVNVAAQKKSFGTKLIHALSKQLGGEIKVNSSSGSRTTIRFKEFQTA